MANVQPDRYTKIADALLEALCRADVPGRQLRVFLVIARKTYGFGKKVDWISLSQLAEMTGIDRPDLCRMLRWLKAAKMITRDKEGMTNIQKDFDLWTCPQARKPVARKPVARKPRPIGLEANLPVASKPHTINNLQKTLLQETGGVALAAEPARASPKDEAEMFFNGDHEKTIGYFIEKGIPDQIARRELGKFIAYWTEPNATGKKLRWQMQKTFEVKRRLVTWMMRVGERSQRGSNFNQEPKGIRL